MDDPEFLRDLAQTAREEDAEERRRWERWERLTDGDLFPEEVAELRAQATASAEDDVAYEAFRPLGPDFSARVVARIEPLVQEGPPSLEREALARQVARERGPRPADEKASQDPAAPWWMGGFVWRMGFAGSGLAATAATLMVFFFRLPPLPRISVAEVKPGIEMTRGGEPEASGASILFLGEPFSAVARPEEKLAARREIEPRCYVQPPPPTARALREASCKTLERNSRTGAVKIEGRLPRDLPTGPATLWVVVAYRGKHPPPSRIERLPDRQPTRERTWDAEPVPIEIQAR